MGCLDLMRLVRLIAFLIALSLSRTFLSGLASAKDPHAHNALTSYVIGCHQLAAFRLVLGKLGKS